jgi:hypothetical protein
MNGYMWELEVCGPLLVDGNRSFREIKSFMSASNTAERVAEDSSRDSILYQSRLLSVLNMEGKHERTMVASWKSASISKQASWGINVRFFSHRLLSRWAISVIRGVQCLR